MANEEQYDQFWAETQLRKRSNAENFDKWILTLSSGGIAISLTVVGSVIDMNTSAHKWLLICTWILFCLSILLTVVSYMTGQEALDQSLKDAEKYFLKGKKEYRDRKSVSSCITQWFLRIAGVSFVIAVVAMMIFTSINVKTGAKTKMSDGKKKVHSEKSVQKQDIKEEAPIVNIQRAGERVEEAAPPVNMKPLVEPLERAQPVVNMKPVADTQDQGATEPVVPQSAAQSQQTTQSESSSAETGEGTE
jgi:hypothetical protein